MYPAGCEVEHARAARALHLERVREQRRVAEGRRYGATLHDRPSLVRAVRIAQGPFARSLGALLRAASVRLARLAERVDPVRRPDPAPGGTRVPASRLRAA